MGQPFSPWFGVARHQCGQSPVALLDSRFEIIRCHRTLLPANPDDILTHLRDQMLKIGTYISPCDHYVGSERRVL